ncbi:MAG: EAL domain-containing protein [Alphaproteobacteria bacterium]|nr:EAL domain-containing protein [Alphaproteobacteria bacterium]MDD9920412.1 EAL domain-containing protein [Alphaproteobacteria bacterium]
MLVRALLAVFVLLLSGSIYLGLMIYNQHTLYGKLDDTVSNITLMTERWASLQMHRATILAEDERIVTPLTAEGIIDLNALRRALYEFGYIQKLTDVFVYSESLEEKVIYPATTKAFTSGMRDELIAHSERRVSPLMRFMSTSAGPVLLVAAPIKNRQGEMIGMAGFSAPLIQVLLQHQRPVLPHMPDNETFIMDATSSYSPIVVTNAFNNLVPKIQVWPSSLIPNLKNRVQQFFTLDEPRMIVGRPISTAPGWWTLLSITEDTATSELSFHRFLLIAFTLLAEFLIFLPLLIRSILSRTTGKKFGKKGHNSTESSTGPAPKGTPTYLDYRTVAERKAAALSGGTGSKIKRKKNPVQKVKSPERKLADIIEKSLNEKRTRLLFQPVFDVYTREAVMCEVFLRIEDDEGNIITPDKFIPIAQRYKLLPKIDAHVVTRVIEEYLAPNNTDVPLAINLGGGTFESIAFLQTMMSRIEKEWSDKLILELRSQEIIRDAKAMDFVHKCRELGCRFSIDYFGGGPAMLSGAKRMNFNFLKLDCLSFQTPEAKKELIRLGRAAQEYDLTLILERVETEADVILAQKIGIPQAQGYFLAIPSENLEY